MKNSLALLMFLLLALSGFSMSNSSTEEPKSKDDGVNEKYEKITQKELQRIAINYYMYMFSEEHEWKGIKRNDGEDIIRRILPFKSDSIILAYMVDFNPDGHALILGYKNLSGLIQQNGSGHWCTGMKDEYLSITDTRLPIFSRDAYSRLMEDLRTGITRYYKDSERKFDEKLYAPVEEFQDRMNFDNQYPQPKWWIEKKKAMNQISP